MKIDEGKVENTGIILVGAGVILIFLGIDGPLIAGSILCASTMICRSIREKEIIENSNQTESAKCKPVDTDNQITRPLNPKNQLDD
jgi:hypothetical protein